MSSGGPLWNKSDSKLIQNCYKIGTKLIQTLPYHRTMAFLCIMLLGWVIMGPGPLERVIRRHASNSHVGETNVPTLLLVAASCVVSLRPAWNAPLVLCNRPLVYNVASRSNCSTAVIYYRFVARLCGSPKWLGTISRTQGASLTFTRAAVGHKP